MKNFEERKNTALLRGAKGEGQRSQSCCLLLHQQRHICFAALWDCRDAHSPICTSAECTGPSNRDPAQLNPDLHRVSKKSSRDGRGEWASGGAETTAWESISPAIWSDLKRS